MLMTILKILWAYRRDILAALAGAVIGFKVGHYLGEVSGNKMGREGLKTEILEQSIKTREVLDEIRDNRPDRTGVVKRLRAGTF